MYKVEEFLKARRLYIYKGYTAISVAKAVGVHEKQVRRWAVKFGWKALQENAKFNQVGNTVDIVNEVKDFLTMCMPDNETEIQNHINEFLQFKKLSNEQ